MSQSEVKWETMTKCKEMNSHKLQEKVQNDIIKYNYT